jgi:hypothetical protein
VETGIDMDDARFEDATERPLRLKAETAEDVAVISALLQDAVGKVGDVVWMKGRRRLAVFLNRFRWEDRDAAARAGRPFERVRSALLIDGVMGVKAMGVSPHQKDQTVSLLSIGFEPGEQCSGVVRMILAGDGEIAIDVECLDISVADVTRPYVAPSRKAPEHALD